MEAIKAKPPAETVLRMNEVTLHAHGDPPTEIISVSEGTEIKTTSRKEKKDGKPPLPVVCTWQFIGGQWVRTCS